MTQHAVSLTDKYDLGKTQVLLNGTQALIRLMLAQKARDVAAGLNTAGYCTGYRGSPLGAVDFQMRRAEKELLASDIVFQEGLNEDLAATAIWESTGRTARRGEIRRRFRPVVWKRSWGGSVRRCDAACEYGRHIQTRWRDYGDGR